MGNEAKSCTTHCRPKVLGCWTLFQHPVFINFQDVGNVDPPNTKVLTLRWAVERCRSGHPWNASKPGEWDRNVAAVWWIWRCQCRFCIWNWQQIEIEQNPTYIPNTASFITGSSSPSPIASLQISDLVVRPSDGSGATTMDMDPEVVRCDWQNYSKKETAGKKWSWCQSGWKFAPPEEGPVPENDDDLMKAWATSTTTRHLLFWCKVLQPPKYPCPPWHLEKLSGTNGSKTKAFEPLLAQSTFPVVGHALQIAQILQVLQTRCVTSDSWGVKAGESCAKGLFGAKMGSRVDITRCLHHFEAK